MSDLAVILRDGERMAIPVLGRVECVATTADFTDSTGALADVPGMSFSVAAGERVTAEIIGFQFGSATGSGLQIAFTGPGSPTHVRYGFEHFSALSTIRTAPAATAFGTTISEGNGSSDVFPFRVYLTLANGSNAGTVQLRASSESNVTGVTIVRGATMKILRIP